MVHESISPVGTQSGRSRSWRREPVKTQIWIALSVYMLVAIVKKRLNLSVSLYEMLQIFNILRSTNFKGL